MPTHNLIPGIIIYIIFLVLILNNDHIFYYIDHTSDYETSGHACMV